MKTKLTPKTIYNKLITRFKNHEFLARGNEAFIIRSPEALSDEYIKKLNDVNEYLQEKAFKVKAGVISLTLKEKYLKIRVMPVIKLKGVQGGYINPLKSGHPVTGDIVFSIDVGYDGEAWVHHEKKSWPCTLADVVPRIQNPGVVKDIMDALMDIWSEYSHTWGLVAEDLRSGSAYMSLPVKTIYDSQSKFELITRWCGHAEPSAWTDTIGKSAFYERCKNVVREEDLPLLKDYDPSIDVKHFRITNKKVDIKEPLAHFIIRHLNLYDDSLHHARVAVLDSIKIKEKIKIPSPEEFNEWCIETRIKAEEWPRLSQPKDSFKKLEIPSCEKITSRRMLKQACIKLQIRDGYYMLTEVNKGKSALYLNGESIIKVVRLEKRKFAAVIFGQGGKRIKNKEIEEFVKSQVPFRDPRRKK